MMVFTFTLDIGGRTLHYRNHEIGALFGVGLNNDDSDDNNNTIGELIIVPPLPNIFVVTKFNVFFYLFQFQYSTDDFTCLQGTECSLVSVQESYKVVIITIITRISMSMGASRGEAILMVTPRQRTKLKLMSIRRKKDEIGPFFNIINSS